MPLPAQIGKYEILDLIGRGGMGVVYKARDTVLGRLVALKVMTSDLAGQSEVQVRFLREARSVAALQHPNIVVVHELGEYEGSPFIAMEYLDGDPLDRLIRNHALLTVLEKVDIILQVAKALQYAHDKGVIHRDVKPGNIMRMGDGSVKVVDFGIAHLADQTITKTGMVLGTLAYLAPEQLNGEGIDRRTDIFSLGVVLYQLLSGKLPFEGGSTAEVMMKILLEAPPPLPPTGGVNPPELQPIVDKALTKKKDERYQVCSEMLEALVHVRKRFEVQTQLAVLEQERKALLAQLGNEGSTSLLSAQAKAADVRGDPKLLSLPQFSLSGASEGRDQNTPSEQSDLPNSKRFVRMTPSGAMLLAAGSAVVLAVALFGGTSFVLRFLGRGDGVRAPLSFPSGSEQTAPIPNVNPSVSPGQSLSKPMPSTGSPFVVPGSSSTPSSEASSKRPEFISNPKLRAEPQSASVPSASPATTSKSPDARTDDSSLNTDSIVRPSGSAKESPTSVELQEKSNNAGPEQSDRALASASALPPPPILRHYRATILQCLPKRVRVERNLPLGCADEILVL